MNGDISLLALPQSHIEHAQVMLLGPSALIEVQALAQGNQKAVVEPERRAKGRSKMGQWLIWLSNVYRYLRYVSIVEACFVLDDQGDTPFQQQVLGQFIQIRLLLFRVLSLFGHQLD